jgi:hypothetical protein
MLKRERFSERFKKLRRRIVRDAAFVILNNARRNFNYRSSVAHDDGLGQHAHLGARR